MTLTQQKQRLLATLLICALVCILLSLTAFAVVQHMNGMWHVMHGIASMGTNIVSRHH